MSAMKLVGAVATAALLFGLGGGCMDTTQNDAKKIANEGTVAFGQHQYDTAIDRYKKAVEKWPEHHTAWYNLAKSYAAKKDWANAADAMSHAVQIVPDQAMYNLTYGRMLYEKAVAAARVEQAAKVSAETKPESITPDLSGVNFEKATEHLQTAVKQNDELWRAHYYIGRIDRDTGKAKESADAFTKALTFGPFEVAPWIALTELYRSWDYTKQAAAVAEQGTLVVPEGSENLSDLYYVLGMAYTDDRMDDKAITSLSKALELSRDNHKARFQRGQVYYRKGDTANAKVDLEAFGKTSGQSLDFLKQQANKMLADIATKTAPPPGTTPDPGAKLSPEDLVKKGKG